jgi:hypothetical protein
MAVAFDADTDAYTSSLVPSGSMSMTVWVKITVDRNTYTAIGGWFNGTTVYKYVATNTDGATIQFFGTTGTAIGEALTAGTWYKLAAVYDGFDRGTLYWGTEGSALTSAVNDAFSSAAVTQFRVGGSTFTSEFLSGSLAALKVWHTELSLDELTAELTQYQPLRTTNLVRYHSFLTAPGTADESGNGNNLTAGSTGTTTDSAGPNIPMTGGVVGALKAPIKNFKVPGA